MHLGRMSPGMMTISPKNRRLRSVAFSYKVGLLTSYKWSYGTPISKVK